MISAATELDTVVRCIELGAEDYLAKPFNPVLLRARLGTVLEKKRLRDQVARQLLRLERELAEARRQQLSMLPDEFPPPDPTNPVAVHGVMVPAREVGGDLFVVSRFSQHAVPRHRRRLRLGHAGGPVHGAHPQPAARLRAPARRRHRRPPAPRRGRRRP